MGPNIFNNEREASVGQNWPLILWPICLGLFTLFLFFILGGIEIQGKSVFEFF